MTPTEPEFSPRRALENEQFLGDINERLRVTLEEVREEADEDPDAYFRFFCECSDLDCRLRLEVRPSRLKAVHAVDGRFVVLPGHEMPSVERIVDQEDGYLIVQKLA